MARFSAGIVCCALLIAGCAGGASRAVPAGAPGAAGPDGFKAPANVTRAVPPPPPALIPRRPSAADRSTAANAAHPAFFAGEAALSNGVYYLALPNGNPFGYYSYLPGSSYIYHFDLGYEYLVDANDGNGGVYLYDFTSSHWWYTARTYPFPYVYDFTLNALLYIFPDANNAGHYQRLPRYFYEFGSNQIVGSTPLDPNFASTQRLAPAGGYSGSIAFEAYDVPAGSTIDALTSASAPLALPSFAPYSNSTVTPTALAYVTLTPSQTFALSSEPFFEITLPDGAHAGPGYILELATANTAQKPVTWHVTSTPAYNLGGNTYDFYYDRNPLALGAGMPFVCAFLSVPQVVVTPAHMALVGVNTSGTISASEPEYSGPFTAESANPSVATVASYGNGTFTVTAVAAGSTQVIVRDSRGLSTATTVTITTLSLVVT